MKITTSNPPRARRRARPHYRPGSLRVQGWLYSVLWPLREQIVIALSHLENGDATWRPGTRHLEWLHDPVAHLSAASRTNLDDLLAVHGSDLGAHLRSYARALDGLVLAARNAQPVLEGVVRNLSKQHKVRADDGAIAAVAADVINGTLDGHPGAEGTLIAALRDEAPRLREARPTELDEAFVVAAAACSGVLATIDEVRRELCDACDLPPAPTALEIAHGLRR